MRGAGAGAKKMWRNCLAVAKIVLTFVSEEVRIPCV